MLLLVTRRALLGCVVDPSGVCKFVFPSSHMTSVVLLVSFIRSFSTMYHTRVSYRAIEGGLTMYTDCEIAVEPLEMAASRKTSPSRVREKDSDASETCKT